MTLPETLSVMKRKDIRTGQSANKMKTALQLLTHLPFPCPCLPLQSLPPWTQTVWRPGWALSEPSVRKPQQNLLKQAADCWRLRLHHFNLVSFSSPAGSWNTPLDCKPMFVSLLGSLRVLWPLGNQNREDLAPRHCRIIPRLTIKGRREAFPAGIWK